MPRSILPLLAGVLLCTALSGCNAHGFGYYLFKPLWTKSLPYTIDLGVSVPHIVLMEGDMSQWKYMNDVDERAMAQTFERHFREEVNHARHAKAGSMEGEHSIAIEAIRLQETARTETCEGTSYTLQRMTVNIDCIYRAPGMNKRHTITLDEMEHLRRKEKEDGVVCKVKNARATFENLVCRGADKAYAKYGSIWHKHRKQVAREKERAAKKAARKAKKEG